MPTCANKLHPHDQKLMDRAHELAHLSTDRSRQVGCVIANGMGEILAEGWNTVPDGCAHTEARHQRPAKYLWTGHAERRAVCAAARKGIRLDGATAYIPWYPCFSCASTLVDAGIRRLVVYPPDIQDPKWGEEFLQVEILLAEVGMEITFLEGEMAPASPE